MKHLYQKIRDIRYNFSTSATISSELAHSLFLSSTLPSNHKHLPVARQLTHILKVTYTQRKWIKSELDHILITETCLLQ